jgi:hypothetical protein
MEEQLDVFKRNLEVLAPLAVVRVCACARAVVRGVCVGEWGLMHRLHINAPSWWCCCCQQAFALKYKKDINKNPEFRRQFQIMCQSIGVDPLACTPHHTTPPPTRSSFSVD